MRHVLLPALLAVVALAGGCRSEPPPAPPAPVSSWTAADGDAVAQALVAEALNQPWTSQFRDRNGRVAKVVVGAVDDRSGDHVDTEAFAKALGERLAASDKVALAAEGADFTAAAIIRLATEAKDGKAINRFQVTLRFTDGKDVVGQSNTEQTVDALPPSAAKPVEQPPAK
jgi:hypothetical protein